MESTIRTSERTRALPGGGPAAVNGRRLVAVLAAVAALLAVGGCGARLVYDRLDTFAAWYVEDYLELEPPQKDRLRAVLARQLDWHRSTQLPRYADALDRLGKEVAQPLGAARIDAIRLEADRWWDEIVANGVPDATAFLAGLTDAQVDGMFEQMAEQDAKERRKLASRTPEQQLRDRTKRFVRGMERWTGPLEPAQRERVAAGVAAAEPLDVAWLDNRQRWRDQFRAALGRRGDAAAFRAEVERLFLKPETAWTPEFRAASARNRERYVALFAEVDATLTPRQRAHVAGVLADWARDFRTLQGTQGT